MRRRSFIGGLVAAPAVASAQGTSGGDWPNKQIRIVIPYPPGFPIMVPGQVITREIIDFMRKLDVKEIHGYNAALGLELLKPQALKSRAR